MTSGAASRSRSAGSFGRLLLRVVSAFQLIGASLATAQPTQGAIRDLDLVSLRRIDRTVFEYTYAAYASNWDDHDVTISATLAFVPPNATIVEGVLDFGFVVQGDTVRSADTFTIRHTRDVRLDARSLFFDVQATPAPLTTYQKIDAAAVAGTIDDETALVYKVFADFEDPRLPAVLLGREDPGVDGSAILFASAQLGSFSQATQDLLAPFLMRPDEPGSWVDWQSGGAAAAHANAAATGGVASAAATCTATTGATWSRVPVTIGGVIKAWVWWRHLDRPGDAQTACDIANELEGYLWDKLTSAFRAPRADDVIPATPQANPNPHGPDGALDIYLTGVGRAVTQGVWEGCNGSPEGSYILMRGMPGRFDVVAHELMHAITSSYPLLDCIGYYHWLDEATASWAEHFAYDGRPGAKPESEHAAAPAFLRPPPERPWDPNAITVPGKCRKLSPADPDTGESLYLTEGVCGHHQYGAYLWFLNLTRGERAAPADASVVKSTWERAQSESSVKAVHLTNGGFFTHWQTFLANNWNGDPDDRKPHRDYFEWDTMDKRAYEQDGGEQVVVIPPYFVAINPIFHQLPPLAAQYHHFDFTQDPKIRQVWFYNDYVGSDPRANVAAIVKVQGEWKRVANWSGDRKRVFCRDEPTQDIQELVLIVSNLDVDGAEAHSWYPPATPQKLGGPDTQNDSPIRLLYSPVPCHDWTGTVAFQTAWTSENGESVTTTSNATGLRFRFDAATTDPYLNSGITYFDLVAGNVAWTETAVVNSCTDPAVGGSFTPTGQLMIAPTGFDLTYALFNTSVGSYDEDTMICIGGPTIYGREFSEWIPFPSSGFHSTTNVDLLEDGEEYGNSPGDGWTWSLAKP